MRFREVEKILKSNGWKLANTKGSHKHYKHKSKTGKITVPAHTGDLDKRTVQTIFRQAGIFLDK